MCHMTTDTLIELHGTAYDIGVDRKWFQDKRIKHYDICKSKRILAVMKGAVEVSSKEIIKIARTL